MPVFFILSTDIHESIISISPPLSQHLAKSLRVQTGHTLLLGDEQRRRYRGVLRRIEKKRLIVEIHETQSGPEPERPPVVLGQSILKSEKMTWVIQKATELGVTHIGPLLTHRVIPRLNSSKQSAGHRERWQRIALEAAQQSERWEIPTIGVLQTLGEFCANQHPKDFSLILVERGARESLATIALPAHWEFGLNLLVGPEGGWTENELTEAEKIGYQKVSLGSRIFRAETATIAALSILQARLGHMEG